MREKMKIKEGGYRDRTLGTCVEEKKKKHMDENEMKEMKNNIKKKKF